MQIIIWITTIESES